MDVKTAKAMKDIMVKKAWTENTRATMVIPLDEEVIDSMTAPGVKSMFQSR